VTLGDESSDEDWESERRNIVRADKKMSRTSATALKDNEDEHEGYSGEFVYFDTGSVPQDEPTTISMTMETSFTEHVEPNQTPFHEQAHSSSPVLETLQPPVVATPSLLAPEVITHSSVPLPPPNLPSPAQLESLYAAASGGDLPLLKRLFTHVVETNAIQQFSLANDVSMRTGFTVLHVASSHGHLEIVQWRKYPCWLP